MPANSNSGPPTKNIDLDLLVFVERYATNFLRWELLTYFGHHPDEKVTVQKLAPHVGRSDRVIRPELGDLAILGILDKRSNGSRPTYRLTGNPALRSLVLKFAQHPPVKPGDHPLPPPLGV